MTMTPDKAQSLHLAANNFALAAHALSLAHELLEHAGYGDESNYLIELATSLHDTGHDLAQTITQEPT